MENELSKVDPDDEREITRRAAFAVAGATGLAAVAVEAAAAQEKIAGPGDFSPKECDFQEGIERVKKALEAQGLSTKNKRIVTSRDEGYARLSESLRCPGSSIPSGFVKFQLPVYFEGGPGSQFYLSIGNPYTKVGRHSHDEGDGLRFIVSGSIVYEGKELVSGDWMFIPKGVPYSFEVGPRGAQMFYCYQCCCA